MSDLTFDILSQDAASMSRDEVVENLIGMLKFRYEVGVPAFDDVGNRRYDALVNAVRLLRAEPPEPLSGR